MRLADRILQRWRLAKATPWIRPGSQVLDVGCDNGELFVRSGGRICSGVGVDLVEAASWPAGPWLRRTGPFPSAVPEAETFDAIVMLAVVEHVDEQTLKEWAAACVRLLRPGGRVIVTVPSPLVDQILHVGMALRIFDGIAAHEHHGFDPTQLPELFAASGLVIEHASRFQLGLNNLFVFRLA
jgi:2-polyprenyl-3-methyl-5-hydroxy-6-metoxy-1,4-benzoquinol methylase